MDTAEIIEKIEKIKLVYRILILVGTILILGGLYIWLVHIPITDDISRITKDNKKLTLKINEAKLKTKDLAKFESDVAQVEAQYQEALTLLPKKEEIPSLLRAVTELGTASNLAFNSFVPKTGKAGPMYTDIFASIQVEGRYHDVLVFFDKVGKMKRIVNFKEVSMRPQGGTADLTVTCKAVTYKFNK